MMYRSPELAHALLDAITESTIAYLQRKVAAGADLVQIFDSWAGVLSAHDFRTFSLPYIKRIAESLHPIAPVTIFAKDAFHSLPQIAGSNCDVVGLGWTMPVEIAREQLGTEKVLQGNLDPCVLYADLPEVKKQCIQMLKTFGPHHIANLGHGVNPDTPLDAVKCFVDTVKAFSYDEN